MNKVKAITAVATAGVLTFLTALFLGVNAHAVMDWLWYATYPNVWGFRVLGLLIGLAGIAGLVTALYGTIYMFGWLGWFDEEAPKKAQRRLNKTYWLD